MYYNQYSNAYNYCNHYNNNNTNQQMDSYVRVLHAAPNAPSVDIYANGSLIISDLAYKEYSDYLPIPSGNYNIRVYPTGQMNTPVIDTNIFVPANAVFTIGAIGTLPDLSLYPIQEPPNGQDSEEACVRFIHLSSDAPNVDIKLPDGSTVFSNVGYRNITNYVCVPGGAYTFIVTLAGTDDEVLTVPDVSIEENNFYSIYAVGLVSASPSLEALLLDEPRY